MFNFLTFHSKRLAFFVIGNMICLASFGQCLTINSNVSNVKCHGTATGSINIDVTGGSGNYSFIWTGTGGLYTGQNRTDLTIGNYTLQVKDLGNPSCIVSESFVITEPGPLNIESMDKTWYNGYDLSCSNSQDGQITMTVSGGVGPYEYSLNGSAFQTSNVFSDLPAGTYYTTIKDANGCFVTSDPDSDLPKSVDYVNPPVTINPPPALVVDPVTVLPVPSNSPDSITIFASQTITLVAGTVTGGAAPYNYLWSPAPAMGDPTSTSIDVAPTSTTTYTLTVTGANGCVTTRTFVVVVNPISGGGGGGDTGGGGGSGPGKTVAVCHNGRIIKVATHSLAGHLAHGDNIGFCVPYVSKPARVTDADHANESIPANTIFPNPSTGKFAVNIPTGTGRIGIEVLNGMGTVVEKRTANVSSGQTLQQFDLTGKASGVYFIKIINGAGKTDVLRVVVK